MFFDMGKKLFSFIDLFGAEYKDIVLGKALGDGRYKFINWIIGGRQRCAYRADQAVSPVKILARMGKTEKFLPLVGCNIRKSLVVSNFYRTEVQQICQVPGSRTGFVVF